MPRTLLSDGSTGAAAFDDLTMVAQAQHNLTPCYARTLQRLARQMQEGISAAAAVAAWTETPQPNATLTEITLKETTLTEITLAEYSIAPDAFA